MVDAQGDRGVVGLAIFPGLQLPPLRAVGRPGPNRPAAVHEQLAEVPPVGLDGGKVYGPDRALPAAPTGDLAAPAQDDFFAGAGGVGDGMALGAGVFRAERQRSFQAIGAAADEHQQVGVQAGGDPRTEQVAGAGDRRQRSVGRARIVVVAVGGHVEVGPRRRTHGDGDRHGRDGQSGKKSQQGHVVASFSGRVIGRRRRAPTAAAREPGQTVRSRLYVTPATR